MKYFSRFYIAAICITFSSSAFAGFLDLVPKLGGGGRSLDIGNLVEGAKNVKDAVTEKTDAEEIEIGQKYASIMLGAKPLVADARLQRYVNTLGRWLALQTERPDLPWTFGVLDDPGFNAFATPGGYVFITQGLLNRMNNEAELAGVLAHEIGHVLKKHHLKASKLNSGVEAGRNIYRAAGKDNRADSFGANMFKALFTKGLNKEDEFEADQIGVVIAARAGYDPYGLPSVLQMLQAQKSEDNNFSLLLATHPAPAVRIEMLGKLMNTKFDSLHGSTGKALDVRLSEFGKK